VSLAKAGRMRSAARLVGKGALRRGSKLRQRLWSTFQSEHTIVNFAAPPDDEEALTDAQVIQIFWNTLSMELFTVCLLWSGPDSGPIQVVSVVLTGTMAAGLCFTGIFIARRVFRWGNRRRRTRLGDAARSAASTVSNWARSCLAGCGCCTGGGRDGQSKQDAAALAAIAPGETLRRKAELKRRSERMYRLRSAIAWTFNLTIFVVTITLVYVYGRMFGRDETNAMISSWLLASGQTWCIFEPAQVVLLVLLPWCFANKYMDNVRSVFNELFG